MASLKVEFELKLGSNPKLVTVGHGCTLDTKSQRDKAAAVPTVDAAVAVESAAITLDLSTPPGPVVATMFTPADCMLMLCPTCSQSGTGGQVFLGFIMRALEASLGL